MSASIGERRRFRATELVMEGMVWLDAAAESLNPAIPDERIARGALAEVLDRCRAINRAIEAASARAGRFTAVKVNTDVKHNNSVVASARAGRYTALEGKAG